jgi:hypothetical protein
LERPDLTWSTIVKPLEGFRFYCFLAQPLALITGLIIARYAIPALPSLFKYLSGKINQLSKTLVLASKNIKTKEKIYWVYFLSLCLILGGSLALDLNLNYKMTTRLQNAGISPAEYRAALWFRKNTSQSSRIIADYYRLQMIAGVCGGKALLGALFTLRNVELPYINRPALVENDIKQIYLTPSPHTANLLMKKYKCDHIFISNTLINLGYFGSPYQNRQFGLKANLEKFDNKEYFKEVYRDDSEGIRIIKTLL